MSGYWWCPACKNEVPFDRVTYDESHDYHCNSPLVWVDTYDIELARLRAENERLLGIIASIKAYCDKSKWRMRGRGAPTLQGQDMAYTHVLNYIDQLERNAALAAKEPS